MIPLWIFKLSHQTQPCKPAIVFSGSFLLLNFQSGTVVHGFGQHSGVRGRKISVEVSSRIVSEYIEAVSKTKKKKKIFFSFLNILG